MAPGLAVLFCLALAVVLLSLAGVLVEHAHRSWVRRRLAKEACAFDWWPRFEREFRAYAARTQRRMHG